MTITSSQVIEIIAKTCPALRDQTLKDDTDLRKAGVDSLDMMTILLSVQEVSGVEIPDEVVPSLVTIGNICNYVNTQQG